jgi:transposase
MSKKITATHERVDDIPAILAHLKKMGVAALLDEHFPTNGNWQGLSLGWTTVVWWAFILSEGDHRLYRVEPWVQAHQCTLSGCIARQVRPRDLADDRLATSLDDLADAERWGAFEGALNQSVLRVYDLQGRLVRVDTTTAAASVTPEGLFQLGHSKDHRPDLPQVKIAMAVLAPLGLPLTTTVVAGNTADAPLYLPEIAKVRPIAGPPGLTYVGDCKMAALGTRAAIGAHQDSYLCPLSAKQMPEAELDRVLAPIWSGVLEPRVIYVPHANGTLDETTDPVAIGVEYTVELSTLDPAGQTRTWQERRLVVRSLAFATSQEKHVRQRVARAVTEINALDERKQGKQPFSDEAAAYRATAAIIATHRVEGLVSVTVRTDVHEHVKRRYGTRPAATVRGERVRVGASNEEAPLAHAVQRLGWRVYATNHTAQEVGLTQGVAAYRSAYLIEQGFGRLKGRSLSLLPLFLQYDHRIVGLLCLLSIALRVLVLIQFVVRRNLQKQGATLTGIYPGQPGRQTAQPTTEMMLSAFCGVTLSRIRIDGKLHAYLTPLSGVQKRLLTLMEVPLESYNGLVTCILKNRFSFTRNVSTYLTFRTNENWFWRIK